MNSSRIFRLLRVPRRDKYAGLQTSRRFLSTTAPEIYDVVVVGGGPAGLSLTAALRSSSVTKNLKVALIEGQDLNSSRKWKPSAGSYSNRVSSLTPGSVQFLTDTGAWQHVDGSRVQSYNGMKVWDGVSGAHIDFNWGSDPAMATAGTIAYMTENINLTHGLISRLDEIGGAEVLDKTNVDDIKLGENNEELDLSSWPIVEVTGGRKLAARLLIGADGANSPVRRFADIESRGWDYDRHGLVATLKIKAGTAGRQKTAYQRFLPTGPVAMLPLPGDFATLVWSTTPQMAAHLKSLPSDDFVALVNAAFRLSPVDLKFYETLKDDIVDDVQWRESVTEFDENLVPAKAVHVQDGSRASFPLKLRHADSYISERTALVGDAAHTVHPLAGQGLNQGLGDAQSLIRAIEFSVLHGQDIGALLSLEPYNADRYYQNHLMIGVVDKLHKLYGTELGPVVAARSLGLSVVNMLTPLKGFFMKQASGF